MIDLTNFTRVAAGDSGLCIVATLRADGTVQTSLVNAGVLDHPVTGVPVVGYVAVGGALKLAHLRARPTTTITARTGWEYAAVEGAAELIGPDDPHPEVDVERLRALLRELFSAAGGTHDDWDTYDRVMREERRTAVLIRPTRSYPRAAGGS